MGRGRLREGGKEEAEGGWEGRGWGRVGRGRLREGGKEEAEGGWERGG